MTTSLTIFKSKYDSKTHKRMDFDSFNDFENLLYELSLIVYTTKEQAPLISPATFATDESDHESKVKEPKKDGSGSPWYHRKNVNVIDWAGWAALDVDTWKPKGNLKDELLDYCGNYRFVCYSTASNNDNQPKFRIVFPLPRRLESVKIKEFWHALSQEFSELDIDPQCKDLSRMYYVPADYRVNDNAKSFIFSNKNGDALDVDQLIAKHPMPKATSNSFFDNLPEETQKQIIEHRKSELQNTSVQWSSYRNCKYWPKRLAAEYLTINGSGWYHKLYTIMCSIATFAIRDKYPITAIEISQLINEFDADTGGWYKDRPLEQEANRVLEWAYRNV